MIKVAIIGAGIGAEHLAAYKTLPAFDVTMIVDQDAKRRETLTSGGIEGVDTIAEALSSDVDIIDICLPPHLHAQVAIDALAAGKHVICEKPLATSMAEAAKILAAKKSARKQVFPVFQYRFGPAFAQLQALIDAGLTGMPHIATAETHWARHADYYAVPWRGTWAGEKGGAVLCHAIHAHDLIAHFMGGCAAVTARLSTRINPIETEDCAALIFDLAGGGTATSSVTLGAARDETRLRFIYEHLTATSGSQPYTPAGDHWTFTARDPVNQPAIDACVNAAPPQALGFVGFLTEIAKALTDQPNHAVTLADGIASIELATAIYASHRADARVTLPLPKNHDMWTGWQP